MLMHLFIYPLDKHFYLCTVSWMLKKKIQDFEIQQNVDGIYFLFLYIYIYIYIYHPVLSNTFWLTHFIIK